MSSKSPNLAVLNRWLDLIESKPKQKRIAIQSRMLKMKRLAKKQSPVATA